MKPDPELQATARGAIAAIRGRTSGPSAPDHFLEDEIICHPESFAVPQEAPMPEISSNPDAKFVLISSSPVLSNEAGLVPHCQGKKCGRAVGVGERMFLVLKLALANGPVQAPGVTAYLCVHCVVAMGTTIRKAVLPERPDPMPAVPEGVAGW